MRNLPPRDPGTPDLRSPSRFLLRVLRLQAGTVACGVSFGVAWMGAQAFVPFAVGRAVDEGLGAGGSGEDLSRLFLWCGVVAGLGVLQTFAGLGRHRFAVTSWLVAYLRTVQWLTATTARLGASLASQSSSGEVVSVGATDTVAVARALDILARGIGSLVAFGIVAALLLHASPTLGLVVAVGVPVFALAVGPLLRPLHRRQAAQREVTGVLTGLGADTVAGLRVLRGVGGEQAFLDRYRVRSQAVRVAGEQVARTQALLDSAQVLLPGAVVVVVTWLGARSAVSGAITPGELVAFYGYAAFLLTPLRNLVELADKVTRAHVAARRLIAVLALEPLLGDPATPVAAPAPGGSLEDPVTGLLAAPGRLTAVVCEDTTAGAELADRLGRYPGSGAVGVLGGVALDQLPLALVRATVLVADATPAVFSGSLRAALDPGGRHPDPVLLAAVEAAAATDVLDGLPDGLDTVLTERARSLSGGQRQRLVLARALVADPEVLVLVEPTSSVDTHTEARIAARLCAARAGRTTVLLTASPLLLDRADTVALVVGGAVVTAGRHRDLLADPRYRAVVSREVTA